MIAFFAQRALDEVVSEASRVIQTGQAQVSNLTQSQFANLVCQKTTILFTCGSFMADYAWHIRPPSWLSRFVAEPSWFAPPHNFPP